MYEDHIHNFLANQNFYLYGIAFSKFIKFTIVHNVCLQHMHTYHWDYRSDTELSMSTQMKLASLSNRKTSTTRWVLQISHEHLLHISMTCLISILILHCISQGTNLFLQTFAMLYSVFLHLVGSCDLCLHGAHCVTAIVTPCLQLGHHGSNCTRLHISANKIFHLQLIVTIKKPCALW